MALVASNWSISGRRLGRNDAAALLGFEEDLVAQLVGRRQFRQAVDFHAQQRVAQDVVE